MAVVRIVSWNIKDYTGTVFGKGTNAATIMDRIYDGTNPGDRICDLFIIIEPFVKNVPLASVVTTGAGCQGMIQLYNALQIRDPLWKVVPPRASAQSAKSDFVGVFYHSGALELTGPDTIAVDSPVPAGPHPWGGNPAVNAAAGKLRFYTTALPPKELNFYGRRPLLMAFNASRFRVRQTFQVTVHPVAPPPGPLAITTPSVPSGVPGQPYAVRLEAEGITGAPYWSVAGPNPLPPNLVLNPATGDITGTPAGIGVVPNVGIRLDDMVLGASVGWTAVAYQFQFSPDLLVASPAVLPPAVVGTAYACQLQTSGGSAPVAWSPALMAGQSLPPGLSLDATGMLHGVPTTANVYTFDAEVCDRPQDAFQVLAFHAPPQSSKNRNNATAVRTINAITDVTTARAGRPTAITGDFNCCPMVCCSPNATDPEAVALQSLTPGGAGGGVYTHQDFNQKTSLRSSVNMDDPGYTGTVAFNAYLCNYFDHIFTVDFAAVAAFERLNLVEMHPLWGSAAGGNVNDFRAIFRRVAWPLGASDHLPVRLAVQVV